MFFPNFTQPQQMMDAWKKAMESSVTRMEGVHQQVATVEASAHTRATEGVDEMAKLMKDTLAYQQQLGAEWRKAWFESVKQSINMFSGV
jgi:hypothetical protein